MARTLAREGLGVVAIDHRLSDGTPDQVVHPGHITDGARASAWTYRHIGAYGGDPENIFPVGHSAGGTLASLLAMDGRYLAAQGLSRDLIKGVIGVSGVYDLRGYGSLAYAFGDREQRWVASPLQYVGSSQPPFQLLYADGDGPATTSSALAFHQALADAGSEVELHEILDRIHEGIIGRAARPGDPARELILTFIAEHTK